MALKTHHMTVNDNGIIQMKKKLNLLAETGWHEFKTTRYIKNILRDKPLVEGFGKSKTGLLYRLGKGNRSILLRADIDALESLQGPKHMCGHSSHTAGLMAVYQNVKSDNKIINNTDKSIFFLFQPAEETFPSGAHAFVSECKNILTHISHAFAVHVRPLMRGGYLGIMPGPIMARGDYFELHIKGKMAHVKNPEGGIDALEAATLLIAGIKVYQKKNTFRLRIQIGQMQGGRQPNTVADAALLKGDVRLKDDSGQSEVKEHLLRLAEEVRNKTHARIDLKYYSGYPVLINDPILTKKIRTMLENKTSKPLPTDDLFSYGCEDFAFIAQKIPSVYAFIGTGDRHDIHTNNCTISDQGTLLIRDYFSNIVRWWIS